jgi:hypothetical protein
MARVRRVEKAGRSMPDELARFRFDVWTRVGDVDGFVSGGDSIAGDREERRWSFLAARARVRWSEARAAWKAGG